MSRVNAKTRSLTRMIRCATTATIKLSSFSQCSRPANSSDAPAWNQGLGVFTKPTRPSTPAIQTSARRAHLLPRSPGPTHRGWYSRGYLPHCYHPGLLQSITYHLADSLPAAVLRQMDAELRTLPPERQDTERRRRVEAWLDAGHGSCVLRLPASGHCVADTWRHSAGDRYDLLA